MKRIPSTKMDVCILTEMICAFFLLQTFTDGAQLNCDDGCAASGRQYNLTCQSTSTGSCNWLKGSDTVMVCSKGSDCVPQETGYTGFRINDNYYVLQIDSLTADTFECQLGSDARETCTISLLTEEPEGTLTGSCTSQAVTCSGLTKHGNPAVTLELKHGSTLLDSTTSEGSVTSQQSNPIDKTFTCSVTGKGAKCLSPSTVNFTCTVPQPTGQCSSSVAILAVSLTIFVLVNIACVVVLIISVKGGKIKFQLAFFICAAIIIICGLGCTISFFVICDLETAVDKAAAAFSIIDICVGVIWIIVAFVIKPK